MADAIFSIFGKEDGLIDGCGNVFLTEVFSERAVPHQHDAVYVIVFFGLRAAAFDVAIVIADGDQRALVQNLKIYLVFGEICHDGILVQNKSTMCIIFIAFERHEKYPLLLLANRDEFYNRPTARAAFWEDAPGIYGGRDLVGKGTWLGVNKNGRFAAVTNYRDPSGKHGTRSRGDLTADFLKGDTPAQEYLENIQKHANEFSGFNLIVGEINSTRRELYYYSNRDGVIQSLPSGIYGVSNHLLDTPWPKVEKGKRLFTELLENDDPSRDEIFALLTDEALANDELLPSTGVPYDIERALSAVFVKLPGYGTRCSTVLSFDNDLKFDLEERVFIE